jgi:pimeloyl-ACP methyl ester carboxylesterase
MTGIDCDLSIEEAPVGFEDGVIEDMRLRLSRSRRAAELGEGWERGTPGAWLTELLDDWSRFDVDALRARLDALTHYQAHVGDQQLHVVKVDGKGPRPLPLLLTHGWPGSFLEHLKLISPLTEPEAHGAGPADAFTLIIPSLPGFGFSGPPPSQGRTAREVASIWHRLMADGFGYQRYAAHGSDLGAGVTGWLARDHPDSLVGIHLATPGLVVPADRRSVAEERFAEAVTQWELEEGGYAHEHATKPATLAAALSDSPAGLAAWIGEKVIAWSSEWVTGFPRSTATLFLSTLPCIGRPTRSLHRCCRTGLSARRRRATGRRSSPVPTSVTIFGGERVLSLPPRDLAERYYNVTDWSEHSVGVTFRRWLSPRYSPMQSDGSSDHEEHIMSAAQDAKRVLVGQRPETADFLGSRPAARLRRQRFTPVFRCHWARGKTRMASRSVLGLPRRLGDGDARTPTRHRSLRLHRDRRGNPHSTEQPVVLRKTPERGAQERPHRIHRLQHRTPGHCRRGRPMARDPTP